MTLHGRMHYAFPLSTSREAGIKLHFHQKPPSALSASARRGKEESTSQPATLKRSKSNSPARVRGDMELRRAVLALCYYQCAAPALRSRFTSPNCEVGLNGCAGDTPPAPRAALIQVTIALEFDWKRVKSN